MITLSAKRVFRPKDYAPMMAKLIHLKLSADEEKAVEALRTVTSDTPYGWAIRDAFIDRSPAKFRKLFVELWQQIDDNDMLMLKILGSEAYNALVKIKPSVI